MVGGGAALLSGAPAAAQAPGATRGPAARTFRAYVALGREASVQTLTLLPIGPRQVVVRTEAAQICYSTTRQGLGAVNVAQAVIPCHGGVGTVIEVGSSVERVEVGQRVIVAGQAQCGTCYNCLRGRADHCLRGNADGNPNLAIAEMSDGTKVAGFRAGCSELMVAFDDYCVPVVSPGVVGRAVGAGRRRHGGPGGHDDQGACRGRLRRRRAGVRAAGVERGARRPHPGRGPDHRRRADRVSPRAGAKIRAPPSCSTPTSRAPTWWRISSSCAARKRADWPAAATRCPISSSRRWVATCSRQRPKWARIPRASCRCSRRGSCAPRSATWSPPASDTRRARWSASRPRSGPTARRAINRATSPAPTPCGICRASSGLIEAGLFDAKALATATFPLERAREAFQAAADRTTVAAVVVPSV